MEESFTNIVREAFADVDLGAQEIPRIDLYMDQILTLFEEGLAANKRRPDERVLTKTMVNNYSKERLIMPIKGKKYSREQVMQLLCILSLKQVLPLADVKAFLDGDEISYEKVWSKSLQIKQGLREKLPALLLERFTPKQGDGAEEMLATALALCACANWMVRICEGMIDSNEKQGA